MQVGDGFPEMVDEDGEVTVPFELDFADSQGENIQFFRDCTPCDQNVESLYLVREVISAALTAEESQFGEEEFRTDLREAHYQMTRCPDWFSSVEIREFESILQKHHLLGD